MKQSKLKASFFSLVGVTLEAWARSADLGDVAGGLFGFTEMAGEIMRVICIITGVAMLLSALLKYKKYRSNPIEVKLSSVIVMFLTGLALVVVGFLPMYAGVSR